MRDAALAIVFSPRRIEESLASHEALPLETAFICGHSEITAHRQAWELAHGVKARVFLLSYDDQVVTPEKAETVLALQEETGGIVSGWQVLGQNTTLTSSVRTSWGRDRIHAIPPTDECFHTADEIRASPEPVIPTYHFPYALTAIPREAMLSVPLRVMPQIVSGAWPWPNPDGSGEPWDKGMAGDWCHSQDLMKAGWELWTARDAEVEHLAPVHGSISHRFTMDIDPKGVFWGRRPR